MSKHDRLRDIVEPIVVELDLDLFDFQYSGAVLQVVIDRPRPAGVPRNPDDRNGVDMSAITKVTRAIGRALEELDPIEGKYTLEVSSPGLERVLRTPAHFAGAIGETVSVKVKGHPGYDGPRRLKGELLRAGTGEGDDDGSHSIDLRDPEGTVVPIRFDDIDKARTVFEWGGEPKPTKPAKPTKPTAKKSAARKKPGSTGKAADKAAGSDGPAGSSGPGHDAQTTSDDKKVTAT